VSNASTAAAPNTVRRPWTIDLASLAIVGQVLSWFALVVALHVGKAAYTNFLWDHLRKTKPKGAPAHFDDRYHRSSSADVHTITKDVNDSVHAYLLNAVLMGIALLLLAYLLRRTRGASPARWSVVVLAVLTQSPFYVVNIGSGLPIGIRLAQSLIGFFALVAIVLLFVPPSRKYFRDCREALGGSSTRPGRGGGLFGPRFPARTTPTSPATKGVDLSKGVDNVQRPGVTEKKRADAEAIAKGAALARSRAKAASKSRRMED
jgi:hypothetical protein